VSEEPRAVAVPPEPEPAPKPKRTMAETFVMWYLGISSLALVALIVLVAVLLGANSRNIASQQKSNIQQCQASNTSRQQDDAIWNRLLNVTPAQAAKETPAQLAEIADLERLVKVKDTLRNCNAAFSN